jgi:uncharacterized Fe-S center protein
MKIKKRVSLILAGAVILSVLGIAAFSLAAEDIGSAAVAETPSGETTSGAAIQNGLSFTDVPANAWYANAVAYCNGNGVMGDTSDTTFSPQAPMSRAMLATVLYRVEGSPAAESGGFVDVEAGAWYSDAISWAAENDIIGGYGDNRFGTDDPVTREQIAVILWRYDGSPAATGAEESFADADAISSWALDGVKWARENNIIGGKPGNLFDPQAGAIRAEVAAVLQRYLSNGENTATSEPSPTDPPQNGGSSTTTPGTTAGDSAQGGGSSSTTSGTAQTTPTTPSQSAGSSAVYFTPDINPEGLMAVYEALNWTPTGNVAVKITTGEPPNSNYLRPELIGGLVQSVDGTFVECNTAYGGRRAGTAVHLQAAKDHGYTAIADVDIQDADGSLSLPVSGGTHLTENFVGASFPDYDSYIVLSHFKGHAMAGFGGAIKNISIGMGSSDGKAWIHTAGTSRGNPWGGDQDDFLESMGDAGKSVSDSLGNGERIVYVNVMNRLSVDCDCNGNPAEPDMHDIGILASTDPVALDQACIDLVYGATDGRSLISRIESRNGLLTLEHAEKIGLGSRAYELVRIDG